MSVLINELEGSWMEKYEMHRRTLRVSADANRVFTSDRFCGYDFRNGGVEFSVVFDPDNAIHEFLFEAFTSKTPLVLEAPPLTPSLPVVILERSCCFEEGLVYEKFLFCPAK